MIQPLLFYLAISESVSVQKIVRLERGRIVLNGHQIPIGRNFKEDLEKVLHAR